ncbi:MAG: glutamate--tRNA ligase [Verrucomicrobiales bacterium]
MSSRVRVRFAPSPTGYLHVGGARTALFNWLFARRHSGVLVLRIEDTDAARNTPQALDAILEGLRWLGLPWDEGPEVGGAFGPYFQSQRQDVYDRHLDKLQASGHVYTETNGAVRFRALQPTTTLHDRLCGEITINRSEEPDMTLRRPDGSYIFHFTNVVDDIEMQITHVIRGEDHLMNTPKHLELFEAFRVTPPEYAHIPLILNMDGSKMSKRDRGAAMSVYIDEGFVPEAVRNFLCLLGWSSKDDRQKLPIEEVITLFDWQHLNRAPARFDLEKCLWLNSQYLAEKSESDFVAMAKSWLAAHAGALADSITGAQLEAALILLKPKIKHLPELPAHLAMLFDGDGPIDSAAAAKLAAKPDGRSALQALVAGFETLPASQWKAASLKAAVDQVAAAKGIKPGALLFPLRVAITGTDHGAELMPALEIIGREGTLLRLAKRIPLLYS